VIALHGFTATGEWMRANLHLDSVADREQFVAVYPDAIDGAWSFGQPITVPMPRISSMKW
jgi:poly(3-hydroxybutyrate) depolymerase